MVVLGVSKEDSVEMHAKFKAKHGLNFPLLSDPDGKACEAYGGRLEGEVPLRPQVHGPHRPHDLRDRPRRQDPAALFRKGQSEGTRRFRPRRDFPKMRFFATHDHAKEMEELLARELEALGAIEIRKSRAGVAFSGTLETAYRICLWSRIASRILLPLKTFPAPAPEKLYAGVKSIRWSDHLDLNRTLAVDFTSSRSQIAHTHYGALKVKDAVVDQFRSNTGERPRR